MNNSLRIRLFSCLILSVTFGATILSAQKGELHEPAEILKIIEESELFYGLEQSDEIEPAAVEIPQLLPGLASVMQNGERVLGSLELSDAAAEPWWKAEQHFASKEFEQAITAYRQVLALQPDYTSAYTMIGDSFYNMEQYDSARFYLRLAIEKNFIDYQAHWFLASTENKTGNDKEALREITIAHILNPGHALLKRTLKLYRERLDQTWEEWSIAPAYELIEESEDEVRVRFANGWMMYALAKALWTFEPGYAEDMGIESEAEMMLSTLPEKEALLLFLLEQETMQRHAKEDADVKLNPETIKLAERIQAIAEAGMLDLLIYYEILGRNYPKLFSMLNKDSIEHFIKYVNEFH